MVGRFDILNLRFNVACHVSDCQLFRLIPEFVCKMNLSLINGGVFRPFKSHKYDSDFQNCVKIVKKQLHVDVDYII